MQLSTSFVCSPLTLGGGGRRRLLLLGTGAALLGASPLPVLAEESSAGVLAPETVAIGGGSPSRAEDAKRLRGIAQDLDKMQEAVFNEQWKAVQEYPTVLRRYVPLLTKYTDSVFPGDTPEGRQSRVAMRYEVGHFFSGADRLTVAAKERKREPMQQAFADMSLAFDRYVKAGNLYQGEDPVVNYEVLYKGISDQQLRFLSPTMSPPRIKDAVLVIAGPDKGRTGLMIGRKLGRGTNKRPENAFVKFDGGIGEGSERVKEIKLVPYGYIARQRRGPQPARDPYALPPL